MKITVADDGQSAWLSAGSDRYFAGVGKPWAVDARGVELITWYEARGSVLRQVVDARSAVAPVIFDPTYSSMSCVGHYSDLSTYWYLNLFTPDTAYCPVSGMLQAARGYVPYFAHEANVANDVGLVAVRSDGGCSFSPDTGPFWDFQLPCKAHDYCYDLRAASFSNTVSDADCDAAFFFLMEAHCKNRVFASDCRTIRDAYYTAVSLPNVVTNPSPGIVSITNRQTGQCIDVEGPSTSDGAPIQQWGCVGTSNQRFRIWPGTTPGFFEVRAVHSGKCIAALWNVAQQTCGAVIDSIREFRIQGALNGNQYSVRLKLDTSYCWRVPYSSVYGTDLDNPSPCVDTNSWYLWRISAIF